MSIRDIEQSGGYYLLSEKEPPHQAMYLDLMLRHLPKNGLVLDAGCGDGNFTASLYDAGISVTGLDGSPEAIARASRRYPSIKFFQASLYDDMAEICGQRFDAVVSVEVVEHLFSPAKFVERSYACLTNNGILVITTPYWGYLKNVLMAITNRTDRALTALWEGGHIKHFSYRTLRALLESRGFEFVSFHGAGRRIPYCWNGMMMVARKKVKTAP